MKEYKELNDVIHQPMDINFNLSYSQAQFSLLKQRDDNFAHNILQYLYPIDKTQTSQTLPTYIIIYNYLIELAGSLYKKQENWKLKHRMIFELDGLFRTYFYYLEHPINQDIIIDDEWKQVAKNMYKYIHSFWIESYGIDWNKLNKVLIKCDNLSKNVINQTNDIGHIYKIAQYSSNNGASTYNLAA